MSKPKRILRPSPRRVVFVAVFAALGVLLTVGLGLLGWQWSRADRPEAAQWIAAVSSITTLVAAIAAAVYAAGAFQLESDREQRWYEAQRQAQASLVAAWSLDDFSYEGHRLHQAALTVRNGSDLPVYEVIVIAHVRARLSSGERLFHVAETQSIGVVAPSMERNVWVRFDPSLEFDSALEREPGTRLTAMAGLVFRDAAGTRWRRTDDGTLREWSAAQL